MSYRAISASTGQWESASSRRLLLQINELLATISLALQLEKGLKLTQFKPFVAEATLFGLLKHLKLAKSRCFSTSDQPLAQQVRPLTASILIALTP